MLLKRPLTFSNNSKRKTSSVLTHFSPVSHFYTPWKRQKTFGFTPWKRQKTKGFLTFSGGIEMWHCGLKWVISNDMLLVNFQFNGFEAFQVDLILTVVTKSPSSSCIQKFAWRLARIASKLLQIRLKFISNSFQVHFQICLLPDLFSENILRFLLCLKFALESN